MKIGMKIEDRYLVQDQIGKETYIAVNLSSGVKWILKELPFLASTEILPLLQIVRHPSLPRIFEVFQMEGKSYYLLEYIEGITLHDLCMKAGGKLPYLDACEYMGSLCRTLSFLHTQIGVTLLHLDIKPGNIILTKNRLPCLIDYGTMQVQKSVPGEMDPVQISFYGTPGYAPPEILQGKCPTEQSDIFMAGMTLFRLVTGLEPDPSFKNDVKSFTSMMPAALAKIILKCIMNHPEDRYGHAGELALDLEVICNTSLRYETYSSCECDTTVTLQDSPPADAYEPSKSGAAEYSAKKRNFQNRVLCIWDNSQFAAELATVLAKQKKRVLLIDADLLSPEIDLLLDIRDSLGSNRILMGNSSLSDLMEEFAKKRLTNETVKLFAQKTNIDTLSCICGNYRMEDYEYYSTDGLVEIIKAASMGYDTVIVSCGKFIYDEFTCVSLICSDLVFIPIAANSMQFREFNRYINFLSGRKQLEKKKIFYVGFDYHPSEDLSYGVCDELCSGSYIGNISYSPKRRMMQGSKRNYVNVMEQKIEKQYLGIIKKSSIISM